MLQADAYEIKVKGEENSMDYRAFFSQASPPSTSVLIILVSQMYDPPFLLARLRLPPCRGVSCLPLPFHKHHPSRALFRHTTRFNPPPSPERVGKSRGLKRISHQVLFSTACPTF